MALPWWLREQGYSLPTGLSEQDFLRDGGTPIYSSPTGESVYQNAGQWGRYVQGTTYDQDGNLVQEFQPLNPTRQLAEAQVASGVQVPGVAANTPGVTVIDLGNGDYRVAVPEDQISFVNGGAHILGGPWGGQNYTKFRGDPTPYLVNGQTYYALPKEAGFEIFDSGLDEEGLSLRHLAEGAAFISPFMGIGAAGGLENYLSNIGTSISNLPTTISNLPTTISNGVSSLGNLLSGTDASTSLADFLGADAAQLANQGISGGQLETLLGQAGADAFTAADLTQLVGQGITNQAQLSNLATQSTGQGAYIPPASTGGESPGPTQSTLEQDLSKQVTDQQGKSIASGLGTAAGAATAATGLSSLKNILDNGGTVDDWLGLLSNALPGVIGMVAADQKSDQLDKLTEADNARYQQNFALGAPSRARYEGSYAPDFDITQDPALQKAMGGTMTTLLNKLSTQGNPFGSPGGLADANSYVMGNVALPYLQNYRTLNANTGGYSGYNNAAASGPNVNLQSLAANAGSGIWDAAGATAADIFTPKKKSLAEILGEFTLEQKRAAYSGLDGWSY